MPAVTAAVHSSCLNGCNGHGLCHAGTCHCNSGWSGPSCEVSRACSPSCVPPNGNCVGGLCQCLDGFMGADCTQTLCASNCNGHGACNKGTCTCHEGWFGQSCAEQLDTSTSECVPACSNGGSCVQGVCKCTVGFSGVDCSQKDAVVPMVSTKNLRASTPDPSSSTPAVVVAAATVPKSGANASVALVQAEGSASSNVSKVSEATPSDESDPMEALKAARNAIFAAKEAAELLTKPSTLPPALLELQKVPVTTTPAPPTCEADCSGHGTCDVLKEGAQPTCTCEQGWTGLICDMPLCEDDCNGRGICLRGKCICKDGWYGDSCKEQRCPNDCSGAGYCFQGECRCLTGFSGKDCSEVRPSGQTFVMKLKSEEPRQARAELDRFREGSSLRASAKPSCPLNCNNRGTCTNIGQCLCDAGYSGDTCQSFCPNECSGQGRCIEGGCLCFAGFGGVDCSVPGCCSGHGSCDVPGTCVCDEGWGGSECGTKLVCTDPFCSDHGNCTQGVCMCELGFTGPTCATSTLGCVPECGPKGKCNISSLQCECQDGFTGEDCTTEIKTCKDHCNNRGLCLNGECMCGMGWAGLTCNRRYFAPGGSTANLTSPVDETAIPPIMPGGITAEEMLTKELGDEPRIDLNYRDVPKDQKASMSTEVLGLARKPHSKQEEELSDQVAKAAGRLYLAATNDALCGTDGTCSGRGVCDTSTGRCRCNDQNFYGDACQKQHCPGFFESGSECFGNGVCEDGTCICQMGFGTTGGNGIETCKDKVCPVGCGKFGTCGRSGCECQKGWKGETCQDPACPNECSGNGVCFAPSPDYPGQCRCHAGFSGEDCGHKTKSPALLEHHHKHTEVSVLQISDSSKPGVKNHHKEVSSVRIA